MKLTRKDIQFIVICIGATALVVIAAHFLWPASYSPSETHISRPEISQYLYVASAQRDIYHKPSCRWAKKIADHNLIGFKARDEAIKSGRRACKVCRP